MKTPIARSSSAASSAFPQVEGRFTVYIEVLERYEALIREWAPRVDLVAPGDLDRLWSRHIEDSLRALPLIDRAPPGPAIDVGTGAGFPGIPLAIAGDRHWTLVEPRRRRAAFLEEAVRVLGLDCAVVTGRAQDLANDPELARFAVATARALAPPTQAFGMLLPLLAPGGRAIVFVGDEATIPPDAVEAEPGLAIMTTTVT